MRIFRGLSIVLIVTAAVFLSAVTVDDASPLSAGGPSTRPTRLAVAGDSLSAGNSRFLGNGLDDGTWVTSAVGDGVDFVGGWARSGATPQRIAEHIEPIANVDVLVILAGTNAVRLHRSLDDEAASYRRIVETVRPNRVLIAAIPPYRWQPDAADRYNHDLRALARAEGWSWGDPWSFARAGQGWADGVSSDGTHPAGPVQYRALGLSMRALIENARHSGSPSRSAS